MTGHELHSALLKDGAALHLDAQGKLSVKPAHMAQHHREAIQAHLCYLLVAAAVAEVQRAMQTHGITLTQVRPMVSAQMLNAAAVSGDVETTRQAATTYVREWVEWLEGETACRAAQ